MATFTASATGTVTTTWTNTTWQAFFNSYQTAIIWLGASLLLFGFLLGILEVSNEPKKRI